MAQQTIVDLDFETFSPTSKISCNGTPVISEISLKSDLITTFL